MLNPVAYTEKVIADFLRYQMTAYPFADANLYAQLRSLLSLEETRATPLMRGPYVALNRTFEMGVTVKKLVEEGVLYPHLQNVVEHPTVYGHQERAIRSIVEGRHTVVSTGTGSGKTEAFLYPIISHCLRLRDQQAPAGIAAVIIYPMNALAEDQLGRLRELLAGTGVTFGMYIGKTPDERSDVAGEILPYGSSKADYMAALERNRAERRDYAVHPAEERTSRADMRSAGGQPRILLTNVKQLELLLTRQTDVELFADARLDYLVVDEAHTFSGAAGAETACLIRRLRAFCGREANETVCIATSATIADPNGGDDAVANFATRFFGVDGEQVELIRERYAPDRWAEHRFLPPALHGEPAEHLKAVLEAIDGEQAGLAVSAALKPVTGYAIDPDNWQASLFDHLSANDLIRELSEALDRPRPLVDLVAELEQRTGRPISEEEVLIWLALGAAARQADRPLLRPSIHAFVRGMGGAEVTFPVGVARPRLWLSAADATTAAPALYHLPVMTCTTCGQHYFEHYLADFSFTEGALEGGQRVWDRVVWLPLARSRGGKRVVLFDQLVTDEELDQESEATIPKKNTAFVYLCRYCGAIHPAAVEPCDGCGRPGSLVRLHAVRQKAEAPGNLTACLACGANGRRRPGGYREPARLVRATTVSDVHVLAQSMLHRAERKRLLVFADNRQDAAFQAGWMQDHARRFRLRTLMYEQIEQGPISIGDLTARLDDLIEEDDELSMTLLPEVWRVARKEAEGLRHREERKYFLRIQVLRELATGHKYRLGLEPWGRIIVEYRGLTPDLPFMQRWAGNLKTTPSELCDGVAALLDVTRRNMILCDQEHGLFSRIWREGDREVQRGYLPLMQGTPKGLKLRRNPTDNRTRVQQWLSSGGQATLASHAIRRWGLTQPDQEQFFAELWQLLTQDLGLLVPTNLTGWQGHVIPDTTGVVQLDSDKLKIAPHRNVYRCNTCNRSQTRPTPNMACMAYRCSGTLGLEEEKADDYDLIVLDQRFAMLRPREHSAQVPANERELLERMFKSDVPRVNTLVATPTLELGVDIGALDTVLMRNVPPLPANYWQRAGRAGRRHRMAVNLTYARSASHDRAYYQDPLKMLTGMIYPPRLNLRNEIMIEKHIHAVLLTVLNQLGRSNSISKAAQEQILTTLSYCFPTFISAYLFDEAGNVRLQPLDVIVLGRVVGTHRDQILDQVRHVFAQQQWPPADSALVHEGRLGEYVDNSAEQLQAVVKRLWKRLNWALDQMTRLEQVRVRRGTLDPAEDALYRRCDRLVKRYKRIQPRRRQDAEGFDDTYTYGVLAAEGFLPGYGLDTGAILGTAQLSSVSSKDSDFDLPRAPGIALREYAPGNYIYANGHRYIPRFYHLEPDTPIDFQVDMANEAVREVGTSPAGTDMGLGATVLKAVPICDVDMPHMSQISDDEDYRFQLAVTTIGHERDRHDGGRAYNWQGQDVLLRRNVHLRLLNVGAAQQAQQGNLGFPICLVCGQSRSPFASHADLAKFEEDHLARCHQQVQQVGLYADIIADAVTIVSCVDRIQAYSVGEALRAGAANVLEMELDDLQLLTISKPGNSCVDVLIYDPMPGGSGLLEQLINRWEEVVTAALAIVNGCPAVCETSCIDCLQNFRNAFYHRYLDRNVAAARLSELGSTLILSHELPAKLPNIADASGEMPVNAAEARLLELIQRAGFPTPAAQVPIDLGRPLGATVPDFYYDEQQQDQFKGVCIYLDGMSRHIHGNRETQQRDRVIREALQSQEYEVIPIPYGDLHDRAAMSGHFFRLGKILLGRTRATQLREKPEWF